MHSLGKRWIFGILAVSMAGLFTACDSPCELGVPGVSTVDVYVGDQKADHHVAGVWQLDLSPAVGRTNCVNATSLPDESYVYTLELRSSDTEEVRVRVLVEGFPVAENGQIVDGFLEYQSETIEQADREGGAITYRISGQAQLEVDGTTDQLLWLGGEEQLMVLSSEDPNIPSGCVFEYDVLGAKVCNEF